MGATCTTCTTTISEWGQENAEMNMMRDSENVYANNLKTAQNMRRIVIMQRNVRMFLARRRFLRLIDSVDDPDDYAIVIPPKAHPSMFIMVKRSELVGRQTPPSYRSNAVR